MTGGHRGTGGVTAVLIGRTGGDIVDKWGAQGKLGGYSVDDWGTQGLGGCSSRYWVNWGAQYG